jgi:hypothetical protein
MGSELKCYPKLFTIQMGFADRTQVSLDNLAVLKVQLEDSTLASY